MRGVRVALVLVTIALMAAGSAAAATYAQETLDRYFRIEFQVSASSPRPVISGYIYNTNRGLDADRMQLSIERLDAAGQVIGELEHMGAWRRARGQSSLLQRAGRASRIVPGPSPVLRLDPPRRWWVTSQLRLGLRDERTLTTSPPAGLKAS